MLSHCHTHVSLSNSRWPIEKFHFDDVSPVLVVVLRVVVVAVAVYFSRVLLECVVNDHVDTSC